MWLKISEDVYLPAEGLVGFFAPDVLCPAEAGGGAEGGKGGEGADKAREDGPGRGGRAYALMKDGAVLPMPFTPRSLAARFTKAALINKTTKTGE